MIPALANYFIAMFKETPLLSAITVLELMNQARSVANFNYRYLEPMTLVGVFFLVISLISVRSEEHTSELQSLMRISYAVFCLKKKNNNKTRDSQKTIHEVT